MSQNQNEQPPRPEDQGKNAALSLSGGIAIGIAIGVAIGAGLGGAGLARNSERGRR